MYSPTSNLGSACAKECATLAGDTLRFVFLGPKHSLDSMIREQGEADLEVWRRRCIELNMSCRGRGRELWKRARGSVNNVKKNLNSESLNATLTSRPGLPARFQAGFKS